MLPERRDGASEILNRFDGEAGADRVGLQQYFYSVRSKVKYRREKNL